MHGLCRVKGEETMTTEHQPYPTFITIHRVRAKNDLFRDKTIAPIVQVQWNTNSTDPHGPACLSIQLEISKEAQEKWPDALQTKFANMKNRFGNTLYRDLNTANLSKEMTLQVIAALFKCYKKMSPLSTDNEILKMILDEAHLLPSQE